MPAVHEDLPQGVPGGVRHDRRALGSGRLLHHLHRELAVADHGRRGRAASIGTRAVAADLDRGFLDLPLVDAHLARPVPRGVDRRPGRGHGGARRVRRSLGIWSARAPRRRRVRPRRGSLLAGVLVLAFGCAIAGAATLASVLTLSRGTTSGIVGGVLVAMYVIFVVDPGRAGLGVARAALRWDHFRTTAADRRRGVPAGRPRAVRGGSRAAGWLGAVVAFRRRDLAA